MNVWVRAAIALALTSSCFVVAATAVDAVFGTDTLVWDVIATGSGVVYYTLETREGGDSTGEQTLWRLRVAEDEPELVSRPSDDYCNDPYWEYADWQTTGPHSVAVVMECRDGRSGREHSMWDYGSELARVSRIDIELFSLGELDSLYFAGPEAFYRESRLDNFCAEIYFEPIVDGEVSSMQISETLLDAAGVDPALTGCPGSVDSPRFETDQDGDLWLHIEYQGSSVNCEYTLQSGIATCQSLDPEDCRGITISQDGSLFACAKDYEYDMELESLNLTVFDAATAEPVGEVEIPNDGDWTFYDHDTIVVVTDDQELSMVDFA